MSAPYLTHLTRLVITLCLAWAGLAGSAELVLTNGRIYTVDPDLPWA